LWAGQERLIFLPDTEPVRAGSPFVIERVATADGLPLAALVAEPPAGGPVILYFHGNGGNASLRIEGLAPVAAAGFGVVIAGYRGYGGNPGAPSEAGLWADAEAHLAWVRARYPRAPLILWGESLGTALATRLAAGHADVAALVLESPFTSVAELAERMHPWLPVRRLLRHPFESLAHVPRVTAPVLVVHAEGDPVVPVSHGRRMAEAAGARLVLLPGGAHPPVLNDATGRARPAVIGWLREVLGR
jgi:hypothetical protein